MRLENKQASSFSCFWFVFHMYMNISNEWEKYLCSPSKEIQYVLVLMQKTSPFERVICNVICVYSSIHMCVNGYSLVSHVILLHRLWKVPLPLQTMIDWSVTFASLHCSDLASYLHLSSSTLSLPPQTISIWLSWQSFIVSAAPL